MPTNSDDRVGPFYSGTGERVKIGDAIVMDGHNGIVRGIMSPRTKDAKDYGCYETGGLLLEMKEYGLVVEPFGVSSHLSKSVEHNG